MTAIVTSPESNMTTVIPPVMITPDMASYDSIDRLLVGLIVILSCFFMMAFLAYVTLYTIDCFQKGGWCICGSKDCWKHRGAMDKVKQSPPPKRKRKAYKNTDLMYDDELELFNVSSLNRCRRKIKTETLTHQV